MINDALKESDKKMGYSLDHLREELGKLRTGRASIAILEGLKLDYYGTPTPLNQVATLGTPDSHTLSIQPWDQSILKDIEKLILTSDLGLTPNNDGKLIRLGIPPLTRERREQLVKLVKKRAEECKVAMRNIRRDFNDKVKAAEKNHEISEDESRKVQDEMQKITDQHIKEVDELSHTKEKDVLET
ncbi:MAG: ribosome recycling factor [Nitrospinaceae bacterium]|jgi:ribosome recycling factor|nr:MAG: ribosome recycling factor [Nitrospinaceae bacterium]